MSSSMSYKIYEGAVAKLNEFCEKNTDLSVIIRDNEYPFCVQFIPNMQYSMFDKDNENVDENGEVNDMTVEVGLITRVKSTLKFKMDSKLLKKLIKLAENVGTIYYHAYRAEQDKKETEQVEA